MFALKIFKVERKKQDQWQHFVAEVDMKNKRIFCRGSHPDLFCKKRLLKYFAKLTGKHMYRSLFLKKIQDIDLQLSLKRGLCIGFFLWNFKNFSELFIYSTAVNRCLWYNWMLGNFNHHLRFTQKPENFDHHSWFCRKYLNFWHSYDRIWKSYLEQYG